MRELRLPLRATADRRATDGHGAAGVAILPRGAVPVRHRRDDRRAGPRAALSRRAWPPVAKSTLFSEVEADPSRATLARRGRARADRSVRPRSSVSAAAARWMSPSSPLICSARATISTTSGASSRPHGKRLPLVLVPTTAGTGSEVTPISVITMEGGTKLAVNARALTADVAMLDAELTVGLPRHVTAATGIDAIVHAVEAYTSARLKNPLSDMFAIKALKLLCANLERACDEPGDRDARSAMLLGAQSRRRGLLQCARGRGPRARLSARRAPPPAPRPRQCADAAPGARA